MIIAYFVNINAVPDEEVTCMEVRLTPLCCLTDGKVSEKNELSMRLQQRISELSDDTITVVYFLNKS